MRLILASGSPRRAELLRAAGLEFETIVTDVDETIRPGEAAEVYVRRLAAEKSAAADAALTGSAKATASLADQPSPRLRRSAEASADAEARNAISSERRRKGGNRSRPSASAMRATPFRDVAQGFPGPPERGAHEGGSAANLIVLAADTAVVVDSQILGKPRDDTQAGEMLRRLSGRRHEVLTGVSLRRDAYEIGRVETTGVYFAALAPDDVAWYIASGEGRDKAGAYAIQGLASRFVTRIEGSYSNVVGLPVATVVELIRELSATR